MNNEVKNLKKETQNLLKSFIKHNRFIKNFLIFCTIFNLCIFFAALVFPLAEEKTQELKIYNFDVMCQNNFLNCKNFQSRDYLELVFFYCKNNGYGDIHKLDQDNDNIPCENL